MYDGLWTVEFESTMRLGKGVIVLNNGRLLGGDADRFVKKDLLEKRDEENHDLRKSKGDCGHDK